MADALIILVILIAVVAAVAYIIKEKRKGVVCIGCPAGASCGSKGHPSDACAACGDVDEIVERIKAQNQSDSDKKI